MTAASTEPSNSQTKEKINRLKTVNRPMYSGANIELLRAVLSQHHDDNLHQLESDPQLDTN